MTRQKHPGGRPAIWGERETMTVRIPNAIKQVLFTRASAAGEAAAVYCVRVLSADHGVPLEPNVEQLVLGLDPTTGATFEDPALEPATWENRFAMNIRPPVALRAVLADAAAHAGVPLAEYCVIRLAARHGYELSPSTQRDQLPIAIGA